MAQWTPSTASGFRPYRSPYGSPQIRYFTESSCISTATIMRGQVVTNNTVVSTGGQRIVRAPSSGGAAGNLLEVGITSLIGVAAEGSTSDGSTTGLGANGLNDRKRLIGVYVADPQTEFIGYLKATTGTSPKLADSSLIGQTMGIVFDSTLHLHFIDSTNSTAADKAVKITGIPDFAVGDTNGPVIFKFLSSMYALGN